MIAQALFAAYDALFLDEAVGDLEPRWENLRSALALGLTGGAAWYWHWIRQARHDARTTLWHVYLFLFGVLGGLVVAVVGAGFALFAALEWALDVTDGSAAEHFEDMPAALAAVAVGLAGWGYHRLVQREQGARDAISEPERAYRYLVAAAGLVTLAGGLTALLVLAIEALTPVPPHYSRARIRQAQSCDADGSIADALVDECTVTTDGMDREHRAVARLGNQHIDAGLEVE